MYLSLLQSSAFLKKLMDGLGHGSDCTLNLHGSSLMCFVLFLTEDKKSKHKV